MSTRSNPAVLAVLTVLGVAAYVKSARQDEGRPPTLVEISSKEQALLARVDAINRKEPVQPAASPREIAVAEAFKKSEETHAPMVWFFSNDGVSGPARFTAVCWPTVQSPDLSLCRATPNQKVTGQFLTSTASVREARYNTVDRSLDQDAQGK